MWFPNRSNTNRTVQAQKRARSLKFRIQIDEDLYYPSSENKGADPAKLICTFFYAYADCWFSHVVAHLLVFFFPYHVCILWSKVPVNIFILLYQGVVTVSSILTSIDGNCYVWSQTQDLSIWQPTRNQ